MAIVYMLTNNISKKRYVGQTSRSLEERWRAHQSSARQGSKWRIHGALRKYGPDVFKKEILFESNEINEVKDFEANYIMNNGLLDEYNMKPGGCGGYIVFEKNKKLWKERISFAVTGSKNGNVMDITNEEIVSIAFEFINKFNFFPNYNSLNSYMKIVHNKRLPRTLNNAYRKYGLQNILKEVEEKTGMQFPSKADRQKNKLLKLLNQEK